MKKRILLVSCEGLGKGGVQSVMMSIVRGLSHKYTFDVLLFTSEKRFYDDEFVTYGGKIIRLPNYEGENRWRRYFDIVFRYAWRVGQVRKVLQENGPYYAIHCNNESEAGMSLKAACKENVPIRIAHFHVVTNASNILLKWLNLFYEKHISKYATKIVGCSNKSIESKKIKGISGEVINVPYDEEKFRLRENPERERAFIITQIGSYCDNKNQLFSLEVLKAILRKKRDVRLFLVGFPLEKDYLNKIKQYIDKNGLSKNVFFHESDADIPDILDKSSFLLHPSKQEGFGIVLIEAQAMGTFCFVSDTVPVETNCGGCEYFNLEKGHENVADEIIKKFDLEHGKHKEYSCEMFSQTKVISQYETLYR